MMAALLLLKEKVPAPFNSPLKGREKQKLRIAEAMP